MSGEHLGVARVLAYKKVVCDEAFKTLLRMMIIEGLQLAKLRKVCIMASLFGSWTPPHSTF